MVALRRRFQAHCAPEVQEARRPLFRRRMTGLHSSSHGALKVGALTFAGALCLVDPRAARRSLSLAPLAAQARRPAERAQEERLGGAPAQWYSVCVSAE